jgi:hypothetical protein
MDEKAIACPREMHLRRNVVDVESARSIRKRGRRQDSHSRTSTAASYSSLGLIWSLFSGVRQINDRSDSPVLLSFPILRILLTINGRAFQILGPDNRVSLFISS